MFSNKDEKALPLVEILLREQEQLPTRRRRCSEDSVRHYPSRGPLPDSGIAHDTLKGRIPVGSCGRRHSYELRLPVLKATELHPLLSGMCRERSPHLTGFRGPTRRASSRLRCCLLPRRLRYSTAQPLSRFPFAVSAPQFGTPTPRRHAPTTTYQQGG